MSKITLMAQEVHRLQKQLDDTSLTAPPPSIAFPVPLRPIGSSNFPHFLSSNPLEEIPFQSQHQTNFKPTANSTVVDRMERVEMKEGTDHLVLRDQQPSHTQSHPLADALLSLTSLHSLSSLSSLSALNDSLMPDFFPEENN